MYRVRTTEELREWAIMDPEGYKAALRRNTPEGIAEENVRVQCIWDGIEEARRKEREEERDRLMRMRLAPCNRPWMCFCQNCRDDHFGDG